jgi:tRNA-guanine family transglycosylase
VAGRGLGESEEEWAQIVSTVKLDLPAQKPLFVCGVGGPRDIVANIKLGFDVLETRCAPSKILRSS